MLSFKKTVISALILGVSASVAVPQAHALLAVVQPVPAMALEIVGACTGSALMIDSILDDSDMHNHFAFDLGEFALGLVILDDAQGQTITFQALSASQAQALSVTQTERDAYNSNLDEINDIRESVGADLAQLKNPTAADSRAAWAKYSSAVSPDAMSAVSKIVAKAFQ
jgi:hypothetical protein